MARLINYTTKQTLYCTVKTIFTDNSFTERKFGVGDIVEGLRYVVDNSIATVSGKVAAINYSLASRLAFNKAKPADTIATDMLLKSIVIDASSTYESKLVTIPCAEIIEDEGVEDVKMVTYTPSIMLSMDMYYSNRSVSHADIEIGDTFDKVRIMNPNSIGYDHDYTGSYKVIGFAYKNVASKCVIYGIAFQNTEDDSIVVANLEHILALNETYTYNAESMDDIVEALVALQDGDTLKLGGEISTVGNGLVLDGVSCTIDMGGATVTTDSSTASQIMIKNGTVTLDDTTGNGLLKTTTPYDSTHSSTILSVGEGGKLVINNVSMDCVVGDTVADQTNKGQFGINVISNGELVVNGGTLKAGWFSISDHGQNTSADAKVTINGGEFISTADFALYKASPSNNWVINDGKIVGAAGALCVNRGSVTINGGHFSTTLNGDTGNASDGTGGLANALINMGAKWADSAVYIKGGTFVVPEGGNIFAVGTAHPVTIQISGGQFSTIPDASYIAEGYACSTDVNEDGYYFIYATE